MRQWCLFLLALGGLATGLRANGTGSEPTTETVTLWPFYYSRNDAQERTLEIVWPLWSDSTEIEPPHRVRSFLWPTTRFAKSERGQWNYILPYFWGNAPGASYHILFPIWWWLKAGNGARAAILPPVYDYRRGELHRWGVVPVWFRSAGPEGAFTLAGPLWWHAMPVGMRSGGLFPLIWWFNLKLGEARMGHVLVAAPAWSASTGSYRTFGLFPLGWHNRNADKKSTYTNFLLLGAVITNPRQRLIHILPLIYFDRTRDDPETPDNEDQDLKMIFPFWWLEKPDRLAASVFPIAWTYDRRAGRVQNWSLVPFWWHFRDLNMNEPFPVDDLDAVFPLYGRNRGPADNQGWQFVGFPLWVQSRKGEARTWYFPYPLVGMTRGPGKRGLWVFPLASWDRATGEAQSTSLKLLLGYLASFQRTPDLFEMQVARFSMFVAPLFEMKRSKDESLTRFTFVYSHERQKGETRWKLLQHDLVPVYLGKGARTEQERTASFINRLVLSWRNTPARRALSLTPLIRDTIDYDRAAFDGPTTQTRHLNVVFPLTYYERRKTGVEFSLLDPISLVPDQPEVRRHFSALLHFFDYKLHQDGMSETRLLWRAWHRKVQADRVETEIFPFVYTAKGAGERRLSIGWKLIEYRGNGQGWRFRLLGLPLAGRDRRSGTGG